MAKKSFIEKQHAKLKKEKFSRRLVVYSNQSKIPKKILSGLNEVSLLFSYLLINKKPDLKKYVPYKVKITNLVPKNQWTQGHFVAVEKYDGSLDLRLSYKKISAMPAFPIYTLVRVLFHEFRHKIQMYDDGIKSVINYPNWKNFNQWMQGLSRKDEDFINHIFHELNPAEVDAHVFAAEMTGIPFNGTAFNINDQTLSLLNLKTKPIKTTT